MKKVLILGAGYTVKPMVDYFIDRCKYQVVLATRTVPEAQKRIIAQRPLGTAVSWTLEQVDVLDRLVQDTDMVIAMVPRFCHAVAVNLCLKHSKTMLTADFMHPEIFAFDEQAKEKDVLILTELGEDPGLDNMGAKQMIDEAKAQKGKITSLTSYGAGLPSFEHNRNPFGYKFSWDPKGLMRSAVTPAAYIVNGKKINVPAKFEQTRIVDVHGIGTFEVYANTDCTRYVSIFGLDKNISIFKGLLRFPGWCSTITAFLKLKLIENTIEEDFENTTYAQFMARLAGVNMDSPAGVNMDSPAGVNMDSPAGVNMDSPAGANMDSPAGANMDSPAGANMDSPTAVDMAHLSDAKTTDNIKAHVAKFLGINVHDDIIKRMNWLGLFDPVQISLKKGNNSAVLVDLMLKKMSYAPDEKDMIIVHNEIVVEFPDRKERRISSMLVEGVPGGYSAMAGAVSLPVAIAARLIIEGKVKRTGVCTPATPDLYQPILEEMSSLGFSFNRKTITV